MKLKLKTVALLTGMALPSLAIAQKKAPNVLIIYADDLGYGDIGAYGATQLKTPNIDRLADHGVLLKNAYAPSSTCSQSRYGLLTGRYWWHSQLHPSKGVVAPNGPNVLLEKGMTSLPQVFKDNGYHTAGFGKWHLGFGLGDRPGVRYDWNKPTIENGPLAAGFDYFYGIPANVLNEPNFYIENDNFVGRKKGDLFTLKGLKTVTPWSEEVLYKPDEVAENVTEKTVAFIKNAKKDKPLMLYYSSIIPHKPITPSKAFIGTSDCGIYGDFIHELDAHVGMLIKALKETGRLENTLIIFTSDNGAVVAKSERFAKQWHLEPMWDAYAKGHKSNGELREGKHAAYEGGDRIPFIVRWPAKLKTAKVSEGLFSLTDVYPSLCAMLDLKNPKTNGVDGIDQSDLLLSKNGKSKRAFMPSRTSNQIFTIRAGKWKMIEHDPNNKTRRKTENTDQLYNLETDPSEENNLFDQYPKEVKKLKKQLKSVK